MCIDDGRIDSAAPQPTAGFSTAMNACFARLFPYNTAYPKSWFVLQEIARDYHANWMTAVEMLNDDFYIGGESDCNIFTLRRNAGKP